MIRKPNILRSAAAFSLLTFATVAQAATYSVTNLGPQVFPYSINDQGQVVGIASGIGESNSAFLWQNGMGMVPIDAWPGYPDNGAISINSQGWVVGYSSSDPALGHISSRGFVWKLGIGLLDPSGDSGLSVIPWQINDQGRVVGTASTESTFPTQTGFIGTATGGMTLTTAGDHVVTTIQRINNQGQMAIYCDDTHSIMFYEPGLDPIEIKNVQITAKASLGINDNGSVVGFADTADGTATHAYLWNLANGLIDLTPQSAYFSEATGINDSGQVVGIQTLADRSDEGFIQSDGQLTDLASLLDGSGAGWKNLRPQSINSGGQIAGFGVLDGQLTGFVLTPTASSSSSPTPEPATAGVVLVGGMLLLCRGRRRK